MGSTSGPGTGNLSPTRGLAGTNDFHSASVSQRWSNPSIVRGSAVRVPLTPILHSPFSLRFSNHLYTSNSHCSNRCRPPGRAPCGRRGMDRGQSGGTVSAAALVSLHPTAPHHHHVDCG